MRIIKCLARSNRAGKCEIWAFTQPLSNTSHRLLKALFKNSMDIHRGRLVICGRCTCVLQCCTSGRACPCQCHLVGSPGSSWEALGLRDQPWEGACGVKVTERKSLCRKHTAANFPRGHWFPLTTKLSGPVRFGISTETMSFTVQWCAEVT